jgi:tRNA 5-methylaminomethyl-2-thiouridine biosynthesis bifunctional protein
MELKTNKSMPVTWDAKGVPHSTLFRDKYFCTQNGYEECCYVSGQGNNLNERFSALDPSQKGVFTIIETGFGTGLSFCCAWQLWDQHAPSSWVLHFISIELYPLSVSDLTRALNNWPMLSIYKEVLCQQYQPQTQGVKDFRFNNIRLTIVFEDVVKSLEMIKENDLAPKGADAWFLNGFSPFSNPLMWSKEVFKGMAPLSRKGTTLSTFTVAAAVRKGLEAEGFTVERISGYGTKKHVLKGFFNS